MARRQAVKAPRRLPPGFRPIWERLRAADERSASRQELSRRLRVSTHTLQRILVRGDVPPLAKSRNTRVIRSWARTVARLALHFGQDPRQWVEMVGIRWDAAVERSVASAIRGLTSSASLAVLAAASPPAQAHGGGSRDHASEDARVAHAVASGTRPIAAGIVPRGALSEVLPDGTGTFLEAYVSRVLRSIDPAAAIRFETAEETEILAGLPHERWALGAGCARTTARRRAGIEFLPIPGWGVRLNAFVLGDQGAEGTPSWREALASLRRDEAQALVPQGSPALEYLLGHGSVPAQRVRTVARASVAGLVDSLVERLKAPHEERLLFVADEDTCREIARIAGLHDGRGASGRMVEVFDALNTGPVYPLALALDRRVAHEPRDGAQSGACGTGPTWRDLLQDAVAHELFGSAALDTAELYAEAAAFGLGRCLSDALPGPAQASRVFLALDAASAGTAPDPLRRVRPLIAFPQATPAFQEAFLARLLELLERDLASRVTQPPGEPVHADGLGSMALLAARRITPDPWWGLLPQVLRRTERLRCRSCSASLRREHNRGVSERFCRFCSDDQGAVKGRRDVRRLISVWMRSWQAGITEEESLRRAERLMRVMPAWSEN